MRTEFKPVFLCPINGRLDIISLDAISLSDIPMPAIELKITTTRQWKDGVVIQSKREYSAE